MTKFKSNSTHYILSFFFLMFPIFVNAQLSFEGTPYSFKNKEKSSYVLPERTLEAITPADLISEDEIEKIENRFAVGEIVNIDIREVSLKTHINEGTIYQYRLQAEGAKSLGLLFEIYRLPDGAELFVYNEDRTQILGGFTAENNKENGILALAQLDGNHLIIDYFEPNNADFKGELVLGKVFKAYKAYNSLTSIAVDRIGINCTYGEDWQDEKHAVCRMLFYEGSNGYYCSGALINNTRLDGTPYFLTANHCISDSAAASSLITYFNYENSTCTKKDASLAQSLSGAILKFTYQGTDVTLLELKEVPPKEYKPYFAGWNVNGTAAKSGACIHHPNGTPKCISVGSNISSFEQVIYWDDESTSPVNSHWAINFSAGNTETGSSGSPLFNQDGLIVGQLHGGDDETSYYGKLFFARDGRGIKEFLDPDNLGIKIINGMYFSIPPKANFEVSTNYACTGTVVKFTDESMPFPETWSWKIQPSTYIFVNGTNENSSNPEVIFSGQGIYTIQLIVSNEFGADSIQYDNVVQVKDDLDVKFENISGENDLCGNPKKEISIYQNLILINL